MSNDIRNTDDVIDSRDVIERLDELESERDALVEAISDLCDAAEDVNDDPEAFAVANAARQAAEVELQEWDESEDGAEYRALSAFAKEAADYADDWQYGATLIRESYFTDYCRELVSEIGDMPRDIPAYIVIDWDATADNLRQDYTEVEFDGVTYLVR